MDTSLKKFSGFTLSYIVLIFFLCIYLIFPSGFSTSDGWTYAANDQLLKSMVYYRSGVKDINNIVKSPALLSGNNNKIRNLENLIDSALTSGAAIYTDCLGPVTISRASIIEGNTNNDFFSQYNFVQVKVLESILGTRAICRITGRINSSY